MSAEAPSQTPAPRFFEALERYFVDARGFSKGTVPEAEELVSACDAVYTLRDGVSFIVACVVDAEKDSANVFKLDRAALLRIGEACRGHVTKLPATFQIWEIRPSLTKSDKARLKPLQGKGKVRVSAWAVDLAAKKLWSNAPSHESASHSVNQLLREPTPVVFEAPAAVPEAETTPWATYGILGVLVAAFVAQQLTRVGPMQGPLGLDVDALAAQGGLFRAAIAQGEWYRLLTSALLHGDAVHLLCNAAALYMAGLVVEHLLGRAWMVALFFVGGLAGSGMSLAMNANGISVGASGAIMGLLAAAFAVSFRLPEPNRSGVQAQLMRILVPSLLPIATTGYERGHVDLGAHLGGALLGGVLGAVLMKRWPRSEVVAPWQKPAMGVAAIGVLAFVVAAVQVPRHFDTYALTTVLAPQEELPEKLAETTPDKLDALVKKYPRDPRTHFFRALLALSNEDGKLAESECRAGLAEDAVLRTQFSPMLKERITGLLAHVLAVTEREDEAKKLAAPLCAGLGVSAEDHAQHQRVVDGLRDDRLCD
ncbi:MAG: rhomboid family intramembrane serine protease [Deltaproteobacteria bacterium]|nr:rhomboid family intramembrane serine protease [Deltaproteobacteria bacterium]